MSDIDPMVRVELSQIERRVVGSLIEKAFLTPDIYPLTTNALVAACNQKTNREPIEEHDSIEVDAALLDLRQRKIVRKVHTPGARATKHRHTLDELLHLDPGELALISILLLRGPQTLGELRLRTERQHGFVDLEATESCLEGLAARSTPIARQLARRPGQKEERWQHLLGESEEPGQVQPTPVAAVERLVAPQATPVAAVERLVAPQATPVAAVERLVAPQATAATTVPNVPESVSAPAATGHTPDRLSDRVELLEAEVIELREQLHRLAHQLGEELG